MRHFFASVVIESGVDIPTLSRWLGHSDGGVLAQRVYGHLRQEHSQAMAQKVTFGMPELPANVVKMPKRAVARR
jgi:integrase